MITDTALPSAAVAPGNEVNKMRESRSAVLKMLKENDSEDRRVVAFPPAYRDDVTPHERRSDFSPKVKEVCRGESAVAGLRMAKVTFVGDVAVGKTCLINRFCHRVFDSNYKATIGVDFEVEHFTVLGVPFNLQIWDTAGQERFKSIASSYYRGSHVVVVVFDMSNLLSLSHASQWMREALAANRGEPDRFLVGTKKDLLSEVALEQVEGHAAVVADSLGAELWVVSSRSGENVSKFFLRTAALAFDKSLARDEGVPRDVVRVGSDLVGARAAGDIFTTQRRATPCII